MKILIVDDEAPARRRLRHLLRQLGEYEVVGEAKDGLDARARIDELKPDVVLLDINMPKMDGLALTADGNMPPVVFITAFDAFAVRAFEVGALDYLLKPVRKERLALALERVRQTLKTPPTKTATGLVKALAARSAVPSAARILCFEHGSYRIFDARSISRLWASNKYTLFMAEGAEQLTDESSATWKGGSNRLAFLRVHRGELVNMAFARGLKRLGGEALLELTDGQVAAVSRRRLATVRAQLVGS